jgi:hypothetical protein
MSMQYAQPLSCDATDADELAQAMVEVGLVELLRGGMVEVGDGLVDGGRVRLDVEADGDLRNGHSWTVRADRP